MEQQRRRVAALADDVDNLYEADVEVHRVMALHREDVAALRAAVAELRALLSTPPVDARTLKRERRERRRAERRGRRERPKVELTDLYDDVPHWVMPDAPHAQRAGAWRRHQWSTQTD